MKIDINRFCGPWPPADLEKFADFHGLIMEVHERGDWAPSSARFFAYLKGVSESDGCLLIGAHGDGPTPEAAIAAYASRIAGKRVKVEKHGEKGYYIDVPNDLRYEAKK